MSEPKRYIISGLHPHIYESKDGFMVYYEDYARLKADAQLVVKHLDEACADNLRLKADVIELCDALKLASEVGIKVADEVTRLKADVERLRKVVKIADGAVDCVIQVYDYGFGKIDTEYVSWLKRSYYAAKERKPSV